MDKIGHKFEMANNEESELTTFLTKELGDPDFCIGGFELWIHGRQFSESNDYWDGKGLYHHPINAPNRGCSKGGVKRLFEAVQCWTKKVAS